MHRLMEKIEQFIGMKPGQLTEMLLDIGLRVTLALVILIVGFWIAKMLSRGVERVMTKRKTDLSLIGFMRSLTNAGIRILVLVTAITQLGVEMTSFVAILGAAGLAIGMAFSGTLSNFAGGVMILLFKPFKVGDYVKTQDQEGYVKEILIFNTILSTVDNKLIILANGAVANGTIVNYTKARKRRLDLTYGISYGDDLKAAKELLQKFCDEEKRILKDPAPFFGLGQLADSSVNISCRVWVKPDDYWDVAFVLNERVYNEFKNAGLTFPFPQMDVHLPNKA